MKPLSFPELYDFDCAGTGYTHDIPFYLRFFGKTRGPILELGAGTGRISLPLAKEGHTVTALDRDEGMLARLAGKAEATLTDTEIARLTLAHADATDFRLPGKFAGIFAPFNFLYQLPGDAALEGCFASVKRALAPRGVALFAIFNPDPTRLAATKVREHLYTHADERGVEVTVFESKAYDRTAQVLSVRWDYEIRRDGKLAKASRDIIQHLVFPRDFLARLRHAGFKVRETFGDFDGRPLAGDCRNVIVACGLAPGRKAVKK